MSAASEQDPNLLTPSHPNEAGPGRNGHHRGDDALRAQAVIAEKDVAIQMRDGTVLCANVFRPSEDGSYPVVVRPSLLHGDHDLPKMPASRMVCVSLLGLRKREY